jgi:hypothetical protein
MLADEDNKNLKKEPKPLQQTLNKHRFLGKMRLAACRREKAMAHYKALRLVRRRPFAQKNHRSVSESVLGREAFLPVWSLSTQAYALPRPA